MICTYCKGRILEGDRKCPSCGSTVFVSEEPRQAESHGFEEPEVRYQTIHHTIYVQHAVSRRSRWLALLLCFFLGYIGIHRFYVGKVGTGVLYLFTCGLFGLGVLVDLLSILLGGFRDRNGLPLSK